MSKLQIQYSKELAKELGKIAVYLPGEQVQVGDIISFPFGKSSFFKKNMPLGSFKKISSLKALGINYSKPTCSTSADTYRFSSRNTVSFDNNSSADIPTSPFQKATLSISFSAEGAIYFLAVDCNKEELNDLVSLEKAINISNKKLLWKDTYLVTSVTIAKKALIIQSQSKESKLLIEGSVKKNIDPFNIDINAKIAIKNHRGDFFIKDWSDDVTIFFDLVKFEQAIFDQNYKSYKQEPEETIKLSPITIDELLKS